MANPIFSTYSTAENRVTSTILAVFERLNSSTVTRILQILMEDSTVELIEYINQAKHADSVPDGRIKGLFDYFIETKITPNAIRNKKQIENHCKALKYDFSKLLILTPDLDCPSIIQNFKSQSDKQIIWGNFDKMVEGIDSCMTESILLLDREKFLLSELKEFIIKEGLLSEDYSQKVAIVPAGFAWGFYNQYSIYRCQPNRTFQPTAYMGFYADKEIKEYFPKILGYVDSLNIQENLSTADIRCLNGTKESLVRERLVHLKNRLESEEWNQNYKYIILTELHDVETVKLDKPIKNNKTSYSNKGTAFVQKQVYFNITDLEGKIYTSELN